REIPPSLDLTASDAVWNLASGDSQTALENEAPAAARTALGVECIPPTRSCSSPLHQRRMVLPAFGCTPRRKFFDLADNRLVKYTPFASKGATNGRAIWHRDV